MQLEDSIFLLRRGDEARKVEDMGGKDIEEEIDTLEKQEVGNTGENSKLFSYESQVNHIVQGNWNKVNPVIHFLHHPSNIVHFSNVNNLNFHSRRWGSSHYDVLGDEKIEKLS